MQVSHVKGSQTINRGELESVVWVAEFYASQIPRPLVDIHTDSSFVVKIIQSLTAGRLDTHVHHLADYDLIRRLSQSWDPYAFEPIK